METTQNTDRLRRATVLREASEVWRQTRDQLERVRTIAERRPTEAARLDVALAETAEAWARDRMGTAASNVDRCEGCRLVVIDGTEGVAGVCGTCTEEAERMMTAERDDDGVWVFTASALRRREVIALAASPDFAAAFGTAVRGLAADGRLG